MSLKVSNQELYDALHSQLQLSKASDNTPTPTHLELRENHLIPLVGYLNLIHANDIQIIGDTEADYFNRLDADRQAATIRDIAKPGSKIIIKATSRDITNSDWWQQLTQIDRPIWISKKPAFDLIASLEHWLAQRLLQRMSMHGVFLNVLGMGVLITGASGIGKSELALELITRGHSLVADDMVEFTREGERVIGSCPSILQDFLEVRGLGIVDIRALFGASAIRTERTLRLIVHLASMPIKGLDRVDGARSFHNILGRDIPEVTLPVTVGRNLSVLVETAARDHLLRLEDSEYHAGDDLIARQTQSLQNAAQNNAVEKT